MPWTGALVVAAWVIALSILLAGCGCGDDDDENGSGADDDDNDSDDDGDADDDDSVDDDADDDADDDDLGPEAGCVVPVDYDGDGDIELLMGIENFDDKHFELDFLEPGTFQRETVLTYENVFVGEGGLRYEAADFDRDDIWDIVLAVPNADTGLTRFMVYTGGDFSEPFFESDPIDANLYAFELLDEKGDGYPDFMTYCDNCGGDAGYLLFRNEGGAFTQGNLYADEGDGWTEWLIERVPGMVYPRSSNVTGETGATQIVTYREWEDGGTDWSQFHVYNSQTGDLVASTNPVDAGEGNGWSNGQVGDFDGDGRTELLHALTYSDSGVPIREASFSVYGYDGGVFVEEFSQTPAADTYAYSRDIIDVDRDGVLDPFLEYSASGGGVDWVALNGGDGYAERFTLTIAPPNNGRFAYSYRRGFVKQGYIMAGGLDPSMAMVYLHNDAGVQTGTITLVSMWNGAETTALATFPLGESGGFYANAADLGGDAVMDVFILAQEAVWGGADWIYDYRIYLYNGEALDEAYAADVTAAFDYPPWNALGYDFTGDRAPDPAIVGDVGGQTNWYVYPCDSTGCDTPDEIAPSNPNEYLTFGGPFL